MLFRSSLGVFLQHCCGHSGEHGEPEYEHDGHGELAASQVSHGGVSSGSSLYRPGSACMCWFTGSVGQRSRLGMGGWAVPVQALDSDFALIR